MIYTIVAKAYGRVSVMKFDTESEQEALLSAAEQTGFSMTIQGEGEKKNAYPVVGYLTPGGRLLSDADIETFADEAERGYDVEHLK